MRTIRRNIFETNSSSTHSITIMSKEDYERWKSEELYYDECNETLLTKKEVYDDIFNYLNEDNPDLVYNEYMIEEYINDNRSEYPKSYEIFMEDNELEVDVTNHTTKSGDKIVIICKYGYYY